MTALNCVSLLLITYCPVCPVCKLASVKLKEVNFTYEMTEALAMIHLGKFVLPIDTENE